MPALRNPAARMGAVALLILAVALPVAWWLSRHDRQPSSAPVPPTTVAPDGTAGSTVTTLTDPVKVFQQAFWRRPAADDVILHAERREWSTETGGIRKWQWFLTVKPGPALKAWLATNPFSLTDISSPGGAVFPVADPPARNQSAPDWFPKNADGGRVQKHRATPLTLIFSKDGQTLHATDTGGGFTPSGTPP